MTYVHLGFVTKYRRGVFKKTVIDDLRTIFTGLCLDFEAGLTEFHGEDDHVDLRVNSLRGASNRMISQKQ